MEEYYYFFKFIYKKKINIYMQANVKKEKKRTEGGIIKTRIYAVCGSSKLVGGATDPRGQI